MRRTTTGMCASALALCVLLAACGKSDEPRAPAEEDSPSLTERAADLQQKTEQKILETAEQAEQTAIRAAETTREAAGEAARKAGAATEAAGRKVQETGEAISDKALSQPERLPGEDAQGDGQTDTQ